MISKKIAVIIGLMAFVVLTFEACAQWTPGGMAINFGGFDLGSSASAESSGIKPYMIGSQFANSLPSNNLTMNNSSMNSSSPQPAALPIADLSSYGKDRREGNLKGYTNIMYPLAESAGFTATAAGGSGGGCGCGG